MVQKNSQVLVLFNYIVSLYCVIDLAVVLIVTQLKNVAFCDIKFHLPGGGPLTKGSEILL